MNLKVIENIIKLADLWPVTKGELVEKIEEIENEKNKIERKIAENSNSMPGQKENLNELEKMRDKLNGFTEELQKMLAEYKNFNKSRCFSNIRELLRKNPEVKIGQIEKEAGVRLGYMSRLEKEGNTSEPSVEFVVSAAKLLHVSIDSLIAVDLVNLTPTEQYIVSFLDKLKTDTISDKLDWVRESAFDLNNIESEFGKIARHPLFSEELFYENRGGDYTEEVEHVVFNSKSFGTNTVIAGDCFNLCLKNGTTLYLMDIGQREPNGEFFLPFAKEAWVSVPGKGHQVLTTTADNSPLSQLLETLFTTVQECMEHPRLSKDVMYAIDSFMQDDLEDDPVDDDEDIPF